MILLLHLHTITPLPLQIASATIGNHDSCMWFENSTVARGRAWETVLEERYNRLGLNEHCSGTIGINNACYYKVSFPPFNPLYFGFLSSVHPRLFFLTSTPALIYLTTVFPSPVISIPGFVHAGKWPGRSDWSVLPHSCQYAAAPPIPAGKFFSFPRTRFQLCKFPPRHIFSL